MTSIAHLPTPALLLELDRLDRNIAAQINRSRAAGVTARPHFKTSKCLQVAARQLAAGAGGFTASTPAEITALQDAGVADVLWAHLPVGPAKVRFAVAAGRRGGLTLTVDSAEVAAPLSAALASAGLRLPVLIEVDTGHGRTGVDPDDGLALAKVLAAMPGLELRGVLTHEGHLARYSADRSALEQAGRAAGVALVQVAEALTAAGHPCPIVSVGSTPGGTSAPLVPGVTECRAGTSVVFDANQVALGSATAEDCALTVLTRVVSVQRREPVIIDAGLKAMSSDPPVSGAGYGTVGEDIFFSAANEEHGFLTGPGVAGLQVGDLLRVLPNHACGTVNMWSAIYAVGGDKAVDRWPTVARH